MSVGGVRRQGRLPSRTTLLVAIAAVPLAVGVCLVGLAVTGGLARSQAGLEDPGALVRVALPAFRAAQDCLACLAIGFFVLAAFVLPGDPQAPKSLAGARLRAVRWGGVASVGWLATAAVGLALTFSDVSALPLTTPGFGEQVVQFVEEFDLGRSLFASLLIVLLVASGAVLATRLNTAVWLAAGSLLALLPLALAGHASSSNDHQNAVDSLGVHLVAVTVWVGGLAALLLLRPHLGRALPVAVQRYSTLAGVCYVLVLASGVLNAWLRVGSPRHLASSYGVLILLKAAALLGLGAAGWRHRRSTLRRLDGPDRDEGAFRRLALVEVVVMAATVGVAVALSRSAPPVSQSIIGNPVSALLGYPEPPPINALRLFTQFFVDSLWLAVAVALAGWYLWAARRLRRRGDRWPVWQSVTWVAGCAVLVYATSGGVAVYGRMLFSAHMAQHMTLSMVVPPLWAVSSPLTLALRTTRRRGDGSVGPRELLLSVLHSRAMRVLTHPLVAAGLFVFSLLAFYYTDLFSEALFTHTGHMLMCVHFLLVGYLFAWTMVGTDPGPHHTSYPLRLVLLLATLSFHAFFGVALMSSTTVLASEWWHAIGRTDTAALLADRHTGGAIAWGTGDLPSLALALTLAVMWARDDTRAGRRADRQADRDGDADLKAYNDYLERLGQ